MKNIYLEKNHKINDDHPLTDLLKSSKVTIVWPTDKMNGSFDFLILFPTEKIAVFSQVTVKDRTEAKINATFGPNNFPLYKSTIEKMKNEDVEVKYILIHGDAHLNSREDHIKYKKDNEDNKTEYKIYCYSFWSLGQENFFNDEAMQKIYELKNNCPCSDKDCIKNKLCNCKKANKACGEFCHKGITCKATDDYYAKQQQHKENGNEI